MYGTVIGRVGQDSELKSTANGTSILEFSVVEDAWAGEKKSTWYKCSLFGKKAESLQNLIKKGAAVSVIGQSYLDEWENNEGIAIKTLRCSVKDVVIQKYADSDQPARSTSAQTDTRKQTSAPPLKQQERFEDDIPF